MVIRQGDLFWHDFGKPSGSAPAHVRPCLVIQNNVFNQSKINTVVVCAITSNLDLAKAPGNVLLFKEEANLPKKSVVNVSQFYTIDKSDLKEKIGTLTQERFSQVLEGLHVVFDPKEID